MLARAQQREAPRQLKIPWFEVEERQRLEEKRAVVADVIDDLENLAGGLAQSAAEPFT